MLQIILTLILFLFLVIPFGHYLYKVVENKRTFLDPLFDPIDKLIYRLSGVDPQHEMGWKKYTLSLLLTNMVMVFVGYVVLRFQNILFLNPNDINSMEATLSFDTIISFMTNTNLQHYAGESGLSYLSQMIVIILMMFTSAGTGLSACMAMIRGLVGRKTMGNFYTDLIRSITRGLLPLALAVGLLLVSQGVPQNFSPNITVQTIEGKYQDIAMGPIAALESIKHLGTNGGGYLGANSSTPLENPNIITNIVELWSMMLFPGACVVVFGLMCYDRKKQKKLQKIEKLVSSCEMSENYKMPLIGNEGKSIFIAMGIIFIIGLTVCFLAESAGNPLLDQIGLSQTAGNMEGKEARLGIAQSALFTTVTTSFTTGTVNNMHDTLTPLGGMIPLLHMMLNVVYGGIGVGLMNMLLYAILAVFLGGLMIGRTPEYLGKKIESKEMKLLVICLIAHPLWILGFSAIAVSTAAGLEAVSNPSFHGLSQILYEYSSSAANNGSGFEGLKDNTYFWNVTAGLAMFYGRYVAIVLQLAIAGSLMMKRTINESSGTLQTGTIAFSGMLVTVVLVFAALTFFPALSLGPIAEHLMIWN